MMLLAELSPGFFGLRGHITFAINWLANLEDLTSIHFPGYLLDVPGGMSL